MGPFSVCSITGHKFFLTVGDDFTKFTWIFLLHSKSDARSCLQSFFNLVETQFSTKIQKVRSNIGVEFPIPVFYASKGVIHRISYVETPQQNGTAERKHQHILARSLIFQSKLPLPYWSYAILHSVHLINRLPSPLIHNKSPFEVLFSCMPNYNDLRVFGSLCFASTLKATRTKFDARAHKCIFLGFKSGIKGFFLLDLHS